MVKLFEMEKIGQNISIRGFWGRSFECCFCSPTRKKNPNFL